MTIEYEVYLLDGPAAGVRFVVTSKAAIAITFPALTVGGVRYVPLVVDGGLQHTMDGAVTYGLADVGEPT